MRASRLLSILILLQLRARLTADELATEFGVSVRTIYRDIDELSAAGIPVQADRGPGGGFQLLDGYRTRLTGLTASEAEALLMIGLPGPAAALGLGSAAAGAQAKMLASLPQASLAGAGRLAERFHLDPVDWYRAAAPVDHLPVLARAVLGQQRVAITYESWTRTRDWRIAPLGLVLKAGAWYVVADAGKGPRTFRVSNVRELVLLDTAFDRPAGFDLQAYWTASLARFESGLRQGAAALRVSPAGRERLARLGAYAARALADAAPPDPDGWTRVRLPIESVEQAALALLGLGPEVEVLAPDALRALTRTLALEVARKTMPRARTRSRG
ncbi:MAG: WYL domain-containing protein [Vicinamibacteria bacterium]